MSTISPGRLREIAQRATDLLTLHGLAQKGWSFQWDNGRRRAGCCNYTRRVISGSRHLLPVASDREVRETLLHEVAHALTPGHHHDRVWRAKLVELGGTGARTHKMETVKGRYDIVCENCGTIGDRHQTNRSWKRAAYRHTTCGDGELRLVDARPPARRQRATQPVLAVADAPAPAKDGRECTCGCGGTTRGGRYLPGHDARHVSHEFTLVESGDLTPAQALARLGHSASLQGKLAQRLVRAGWHQGGSNLTWSR